MNPYIERISTVTCSRVVDWHRFDADPDPNPDTNFHFNADLDPDPDRFQSDADRPVVPATSFSVYNVLS
jgi:hypothetical protein